MTYYGTKDAVPMADEPNPKGTTRLKSKLVLLGLAVAFTATLTGMILGFVVVAVPQLKGSVNEISWFASICSFVAPVGSMVIGVIIDKFGRRSALLWGIAPSILGWLLIWLSENNITLVLVGRAACGLSFGALIYPPQVYAAECLFLNHQRLLDSFKIWTVISSTVGALFVLIMSFFLAYRELAGVIAIISIIQACLICLLLPESPIWLELQNRSGDAEWSRIRLGIDISPLLAGGISAQETGSKFSISTLKSDLDTVKREDVYKPLVATVIFFIPVTATGAVPVGVYMINIIENRPVAENSIDADNVRGSDSLSFAIVSQLLSLTCSGISCVVLPYLRVRRLSIPCIFALGAGMGVLAYTEVVQNADSYTIRVLAIWLVAVMYTAGVSNLLGALLGYIFPSDCKGFGSVVLAFYILLSAVSIKLYPYLESYFHEYLYYGNMFFALLAGVFTYFYLPETVGKSQKEISDGFRSNHD